MSKHPIGLLILAVLTAAGPGCGWAADDENTRLREMLHRTQEALRQAQADNADLSRAKVEAEQKLKDASQQLDSVKSSSKAAQSGKATLQAQLTAARSGQTALQHSVDDANHLLVLARAKLTDAARDLAARDAELQKVTQSLEQSQAANTRCEQKNLTLYGYAQDVLNLYRKKGVWAALSQKDPVLGLKEVEVQNVVQEYQLKYDSQKVKP